MFILREFGYTIYKRNKNWIEGVRTLGYILPIRPLQSEQYASRLNMEKYNFASIDRVSPVKLGSDFLEEFEEKVYLFDNNKEKDQENSKESKSESENVFISSSDLYPGYIYPNPANLSPAISQAVGKGISVNYYA